MARYSKRQAYPVRQKEARKTSAKRDSNEFTIRTGWTQEWTCPKRLRRNRALDVREIVQGPFSTPKLLRTRPFVALSPCQISDAKGNVDNDRNGIPDTWREYLASKGYCGATEARVLKKDLIPCYIRCTATCSLWNEFGLPFVQGIPDPWKSGSLLRRSKCSRKRCVRDKKLSTRIASNYDGDDEAEVERNERKQGQSNAENTEDAKGPEDAKPDSNFPSIKQELYKKFENTDKRIHGGKRIDLDQPVGESLKSSQTKDQWKVKSNINVRSLAKKAVDNVEKMKAKELSAKEIAASPPDSSKKADRTIQTPRPNVACCNCTLQNYPRYFDDRVNKCREMNISEHVLCQDCETVYRQSVPRRLDSATKAANVCVPAPNKFLRQKIAAPEEICKWTKLKLCTCLQKAKERFHDTNRQNYVRMRDTAASDKDLKLICCRCDCPYLRVVSNAADEEKCLSNTKRSSNMLQKERTMKYNEPDRISKNPPTRIQRNTGRNSLNGRCTCSENKRFTSKRDIERTPQSTAREWRDNMKNVHEIPRRNKPDNTVKNECVKIDKGGEGNVQNTETNIHGNIDKLGTKKVTEDLVRSLQINVNVERREFKKESPEDYRSDRTSRMKHNLRHKNRRKKVESETLIEKMKRLHYSKSDKTNYAQSDSGTYADVSDNLTYLVEMNISVTARDRSPVSSVTYIQRLNNSSTIRRLNRLKQPKRRHRRSLIPISKNCQSILGAANKIISSRRDFSEPCVFKHAVNEKREDDFLAQMHSTSPGLVNDKSNRGTELFEEIIDAGKNSKARKARRYMHKRLKHRMYERVWKRGTAEVTVKN